ncbi:Mitochondrial chaperone BCS1 [Thelohanellus kitauei]|uniref:Mitochondrial chaperone BCS1 n=1 Tax=Thelohanellus kitauei TaxID=669202 RepID=A0A0C2IRS1_THEKT|nr:Mitochondrial chaperone BCS1 [Thelohanellus kitauei]
MPDLFSSISSNPYFNAGLGLVGITSVLAVIRRGAISSSKHIYRYYTTTLEVNRNDKSFEWVLQWLSNSKAVRTSHKSVSTDIFQDQDGKMQMRHIFPPAIGPHFFKYKGHYIKVERSRASPQVSQYGHVPFETIQFMTLGRNSRILEQLICDARNEALDLQKGKTLTYIPDSAAWRVFGHPRVLRPLDSVILDDDVVENIISDITEFIGSAEWYRTRGIPHRRGYLLYGPPGCGKTSLITAISSSLSYNICQLGLGEPGLTDDRFQFLLNTAPLQSLIVLEDVDAVLYDVEQAKRAYRLTHSGLLNALDGIVSSEQRIIFMTTNFFEKLDKALIRPGRVDYKQYIGCLTKSQISRMFQKFYSGVDFEFSNQFVERVLDLNLELTPAQLQAYMLRYKNDPKLSCQNVAEIRRI